MEKDSLEMLDHLIKEISQIYKKISQKWSKDKGYNEINLKKNCIVKIQTDELLGNLIRNYRDFLMRDEDIICFPLALNQIGHISTRIKLQNSIEYKIDNYVLNHECGNVPINKCLNDLFGLRVIIAEEISHKDIQNYITNKYPDLKCIDSSKGEYIATHVYFKYDNFSFPWELQIWKSSDKDKNFNSHKQYKQEYTKWERESAGGV